MSWRAAVVLFLVVGAKAELVFRCSFEDGGRRHGPNYKGTEDLCGMEQDTTDDFNWQLNKLNTASWGTGPDGASAGLYYLYIESSYPRKKGEKARITTPPMAKKTAYVLRFDYNMFGNDVQSLIVYQKIRSNGEIKKVWSRSGQQNKAIKWLTTVQILMMSPGDQLIFQGSSGSSSRGDIGLDNISIDTLL